MCNNVIWQCNLLQGVLIFPQKFRVEVITFFEPAFFNGSITEWPLGLRIPGRGRALEDGDFDAPPGLRMFIGVLSAQASEPF